MLVNMRRFEESWRIVINVGDDVIINSATIYKGVKGVIVEIIGAINNFGSDTAIVAINSSTVFSGMVRVAKCDLIPLPKGNEEYGLCVAGRCGITTSNIAACNVCQRNDNMCCNHTRISCRCGAGFLLREDK